MTMREQLIQTCDTYCQAAGIGRKRLSTLILNGGSKLDHVANGGDLYTGTYEHALQWLSDHWPDEADWPEGIARPALSEFTTTGGPPGPSRGAGRRASSRRCPAEAAEGR